MKIYVLTRHDLSIYEETHSETIYISAACSKEEEAVKYAKDFLKNNPCAYYEITSINLDEKYSEITCKIISPED